jgi:hypothetical protein
MRLRAGQRVGAVFHADRTHLWAFEAMIASVVHHRLFMSAIIGHAIRNIHDGVCVNLLPLSLYLEETAVSRYNEICVFQRQRI